MSFDNLYFRLSKSFRWAWNSYLSPYQLSSNQEVEDDFFMYCMGGEL